MVNGYINTQQIQPQAYQRQQIQPQVQVAQNPQAQPENSQPSSQGVPYQYMNPSYTPQMSSQAASNPGGTSAVSINIISPSVYGPQGQTQIPYSPIYSYPQATQVPPPVQIQQPQANATANATATATATVENKPAEKKKTTQKNIVPLTNEYIQQLEGLLKDSDEQNRITGIKQVMLRFKDDESRKNDAALTALLNTALQDKSKDVRFLAMTTIASGYSAGDQKTADLLKNIKEQSTTNKSSELNDHYTAMLMNTNSKEDSTLAANALMKMSEQTQKVEIEQN